MTAGLNENSARFYRSSTRIVTYTLAALAMGVAGTVIVRASDNPGMIAVMREFNAPIRKAVQAVMPSPERLPAIFRTSAPQPKAVQAWRPATAPRGTLPARGEVISAPTGFFPSNIASTPEPLTVPKAPQKPRGYARKAVSSAPDWKEGQGLPQTTSYCVRLCDGYAFPIGNPGSSSGSDAHDAACTMACPGAQTALYTAAAGAKDIHDARTSGGAPYSSLRTAFAYRTSRDQTCTCRPKGSSISTAALMSDFTMRRGDLVMSRAGMRHFDGARQFPYQSKNFADALARLTDKNERARVRAMEAASVRGILPAQASAALKERVGDHIRQATRVANAGRKIEGASSLKRGFEEMKAQVGPMPVRTVDKRVGFVAMN